MRTALVLAGALALAAAPALPAQIGNVSDPGGIIITGSEIAPAIPTAPREERNAIFLRDHGRLRFSSPEVACAVSRMARETAEDLRVGRVTAPAGRSLPPGTQARLGSLLASTDSVADPAFLEELVRGAGTEGERNAGWRLVSALKGLFNGPDGCTSPRMRAERWSETFQAYGAFVDAASPALVREPSDAMLATQAVLARIVEVARAAALANDD